MFLILKVNSQKRTNNSCAWSFLVDVTKTWLVAWFYSLLLLLSGDVEINPWQKHNSSKAFSICHWNLNNISAHNYAKVFPLKAHIAIHKFDILWKFGFRIDFVSWIKTILKNQESWIINGGKTAKYFKLERGAWQGEPISAYLFILVLEIFLIFVKNNPKVKGLIIFKH